MKRTNLLYLKDILIEIYHIEQTVNGISLEVFENNYEKHYTAIRALEIIGEAAGKIDTEIQNKHSEVEWFKIRGLRNVIVHEYFELELEIIWNIIHKDIPILKKQVERILETE